MSAFDLDSLITEISPEAPCGEDVSYDPAYLELQNLLRPQKGGAAGGDEDIQEPNWQEVASRSYELLSRSKHLTVVVCFVVALAKLEAMSGLRDGLSVLNGLLERFWDDMFPLLDSDDNDDPTERLNALLPLNAAEQDDPVKLGQHVIRIPLCRSRQMGSFSWRDVQIAKGERTIEESQTSAVPDMSVIDAAFKDTSADDLKGVYGAALEASDYLDKIEAVFSERASAGQTPDLGRLHKELEKIQQFLAGYLEEEVLPGAHDVTAGAPPRTASVSSASDEIQSRSDVLHALDRICKYFDQHEPSSPIPLLLRRAQKLVSKNFLEIIQDVCPDAMRQIEVIGGSSSTEQEDSQT